MRINFTKSNIRKIIDYAWNQYIWEDYILKHRLAVYKATAGGKDKDTTGGRDKKPDGSNSRFEKVFDFTEYSNTT